MTSIREMLRRLLGEGDRSEAAGQAEQPSPDYSYRVYWMKTARSWTDERLDEVREEVQRVVQGTGFEANPFERRYHVEAVDDQKHAGASLLALLEVIDALKKHTTQPEKEQSDDE